MTGGAPRHLGIDRRLDLYHRPNRPTLGNHRSTHPQALQTAGEVHDHSINVAKNLPSRRRECRQR